MGYKDYNDYELIELVNDNDELAINILMAKYAPLITMTAKEYYQYLLQHQVEEVIFEDLMILGEETLLKVVRSYSQHSGTLFYTYFLVCLRSKFNTFVRTMLAKKNQPLLHYQSYEYEVEDFCAVAENINDNPQAAYQYAFLQEQIQNYLHQLTFIQQSVIELRLNGFCYYEIANLLQISKDYISKTVKKVKEELKKIIN